MAWDYLPTEPPRRRRGLRPAVASVVVLAVLLVVTGVGVALGAVRSGLAPGRNVPALPSPDAAARQPAPTNVDTTAVARTVDRAVVDIFTNLGFQGARAAGTGVVVTSSGLVLTNNHVIAGATTIRATEVGTGQAYGATVVGYDRADDVALLQLNHASGLPAVSVGDSATVQVGEHVVAIGNAGGVGGIPSVAPGTVTAVDQSITATDASSGSSARLTGLIQVAANVQPGDSGGPLVDGSGRVIGIDTAASAGVHGSGGGVGYAIPIDRVLTIANQIEAGHSSARVHIGPTAMLGVESTAAAGPGNPATAGVGIAGVVQGSAADLAGMTPGGVIEAVDGTAISSPRALAGIIAQHRPGDSVRITWTDAAGQQHQSEVQLAAGPPA